MLAELRIRGLGVISSADVPLHPGFTVVTGETGAGKTMVVHSLGLLLGGKADTALVRGGAARATVEGRLADLPGAALARAVDAGAELDEGDLIAGRSVGAEGGRSRAWLGGASVPATVLGEVTGAAVVVHGQHDQQRFVRPGEQRQALDSYAGDPLGRVLSGYQDAYDDWRTATAELADLRAREETRGQEVELLTAELARIAAVNPSPGEDSQLRARADRLRNAGDLQSAAAGARAVLAGGEDTEGFPVTDLAHEARRLLATGAVHDAQLGEFATRAAEIGLLAGDLASDLASYAAGIEADPAALAGIEDRRAELTSLTRRHGPDVDAALAWAASARLRLEALEGSDERCAVLESELGRLEAALDTQAAQLTALRLAAAAALADGVNAELAGLAMGAAHVSVEVNPAPRGRHGADEVALLLTPHPGAPARPLGRGASGGELSRVMLAVEVVLAGAGAAATLVFDEVDAGVGGRAAVEIGRRLARLAQTHQVICVTHLAQVAAFADAHLRVVRAQDGSVTVTDVEELDNSARVIELSRMLGGIETSDLAQGHARELLTLAATAKSA